MYTTCQFSFAISDPTRYGEETEKKEWRRAMLEDMKSIKKMAHEKWWNYQKTKMQLI